MDELERICVAESVPLDKMRNRRRNYELSFANAIRALDGQAGVPVSTGGLETVMAERVQPMLALRRTSFGNIERTNRLFDLLIAREHGAFIDLTDVITLLRNDALPEGAGPSHCATSPTRAQATAGTTRCATTCSSPSSPKPRDWHDPARPRRAGHARGRGGRAVGIPATGRGRRRNADRRRHQPAHQGRRRTCRRGEVTSSWSARANPGLPVDEQTFRVHGISTEELADEPAFDAVEPERTRRLRGIDGEHVALVPHNAGSDIAVLWREYKLLDQVLPDLPVLDTMYLPKAVGVRPASRSVADLLAELRLSNPKAHNAAGDARATADATLGCCAPPPRRAGPTSTRCAKAMERRASTTSSIRGPGRRRQVDPDEFDVDAKRAQLLGRLERLRVRPTDQLDEDGSPIPVRRHHPKRREGRDHAASRCTGDLRDELPRGDSPRRWRR